MTDAGWAMVFLAVAIVVEPGPTLARSRLAAVMGRGSSRGRLPTEHLLPTLAAVMLGVLAGMVGGWVVALPVGVGVWFGARRVLRKPTPVVDPLRLAAGWDLLAACLRSGLPVPTAIRAIAGKIPGEGGRALRSTADLLSLGADPVEAWRPAANLKQTAALARSARRTARSGTELAAVASALATEVRVSAGDLSEVRAQRAGVLITGPLGLCFLPAFMCLGIAPVITGLAGRLGLTG